MAGRDRFGSRTTRRSVLAVLVFCAAPGFAQETVHIVHLPHSEEVDKLSLESERLRFEPWVGVLFDAYRNEGGDGRPGWIAGARLGYEPGPGPGARERGWRVIAEVARAETAEAGTATLGDSLVVGFRSEWWLATGGAEWDVVTGWMGVTVEGQAGAAWLQREIVAGDPVPSGTPGTSDRARSEPVPAVVAGISVWRHIGHRLQVRLRVEDIVTDPLDALEHSPAIALGARFLFE